MSVTFKLQDFEGPLDLLLYLIEKNKMNIYDIEIASITDQYMVYLEDTSEVELEQLSDFIVMAATLLFIKSKMLLPKTVLQDELEEDPREELVRKLLEYKKVKYVSEQLKEHESESEYYCFRNKEASLEIPEVKMSYETILENVTLKSLYDTFELLMKQKNLEIEEKKERKIDHNILKKDVFTIEQKSTYILNLIILKKQITFFEICSIKMPKIELIVTFMALLELVHKKQVSIVQENPLGDILITGGRENAENRT